MFYLYIVISAASLLIFDNFFEIFRQGYSLWLVPLLFIGIFLSLILIHTIVTLAWVLSINTNKPMKNQKAFRAFVKLTIPLILKVARVKVDSRGEEIVPKDRRMFFICNHQHDFDPVMILSVFPDNEISFIGKKEIYTEMPFFGKAMHGLGCLPIDRENDRAAAKTIIEASRLIKEDKGSIGLFPEGYTSKTCELLPFRNGSLKIAYRSSSPIVVCVINNTRSVPKRLVWRSTKVDFRVLGVIEPEEYENLTTVELGDKLHDMMKAELEKIRS